MRFSDKLLFLIFIATFILLGITLLAFQNGQAIAFYILSGAMLLSAIGVLTISDIVRSAFLLAMTFVCVGGLFVLLNADFLAAAQILIYGGAIVILMVFGVMLTKSDQQANSTHTFEYHILSIGIIGCGFGVLIFRAVRSGAWRLSDTPLDPALNTSQEIGKLFFNTYLIPFELASVILLMALIGAVVIAKKEKTVSE